MSLVYNSKSLELARRLRRELTQKQLPAGSAVASVRALAARYQVSTATADRILRHLVNDGFLFRVPKSGTFIRHDPPRAPRLGYIGSTPGPESGNYLYNAAFHHLCQFLDERQCAPAFIAYHELLNPALAAERLAPLQGIILEGSFIDAQTLPVIRRFNGRIVVVGFAHVLDDITCSQVIPDFASGLHQLAETYDLNTYKQFLIVSATHRNAQSMCHALQRFFAEQNIPPEHVSRLEFATTGSFSAESQAQHYFSTHPGPWHDTLIITLSDHFSFGLQAAFHNQPRRPDLCSIDNLEDFLPADRAQTKLFTSIDKSMPRIYAEAAELLLRLLQNHDDRNFIVSVPTRLIPRSSMRAPRLAPPPR